MMEAQGAAEKPPGLRYKVGRREMGRMIQVTNFGGAIEKQTGISGMRPNGTKTMWELEAVMVCADWCVWRERPQPGVDSGWRHSKKQVRENLISALDSCRHAP